jgi:mono/diheme cytochrome c family protein
MRAFILGLIVAVVVIGVAGYCYIRFGFVDPRADIPVGALESKLAMPALDASVDRRAPEVKNPMEVNEPNLVAGMKIYQSNCAGCHGDIHQPHGTFGTSLYPRAPQFLDDAPDMADNENFYIVRNGIRFSGMPASEKILSEQQTWQVVTFLSQIDKLPPQVSAQWKALADAAAQADPSSQPPSSTDKMQMR